MFVSQEVARRTVTNTQVDVDDVDGEEETVAQTVHLANNFSFSLPFLVKLFVWLGVKEQGCHCS